MPERLQKREQERVLEAERRKQSRQDQEVAEEKRDFFAAAFARERAAVEALLRGGGDGAEAPAPASSSSSPEERLEEAAARLQALQKLVNDALRFLAAYDLRQAQEALARLQAALAERRRELRPKTRFAFKSRRKEAPRGDPAAPSEPTSAPPGPEPAGVRLALDAEGPDACGFSHRQSEQLQKGPDELRQRHVLLSDLTDCTVRLRGNPNTLRLSRARRCTVLCGPVSTSVFLQDCSDCLLAVACQQLRVHATADTRVFLHVTSRAIVEDCRGIRVAPFAWTYPGLDADFAASGLDRGKNHWDQVDDFNWLARDAASPNWSILPEDERELPSD